MVDAQKVRVGVDWGSSSFRAYRFDSIGEIVDFKESADGIKTVDHFEAVLLSQIGAWLQPGDMVLLSGMITSRNGWVETPYIPCPFELSQLLQQSVARSLANGCTLLFLPGACVNQPADVMRGEELQLYGAVQQQQQLVVLPGTHSKWAFVSAGVLEKFHTVVTGELFDVLINQTLIGGLATSREHIDRVFSKGVDTGFNTEAIVSQLFTARSSVLLGQLAPEEVHSYLSGLLIGNEIRESYRLFSADLSVLVVGSGMLCSKYTKAFDLLGINVIEESPHGDPAMTDTTTGVMTGAGLGFQKLIKAIQP